MTRRRTPRRALLFVIASGWVVFLFLFALIAGQLGLPLGIQATMVVVVVTLLIYVVGRDVWRDDE